MEEYRAEARKRYEKTRMEQEKRELEQSEQREAELREREQREQEQREQEQREQEQRESELREQEQRELELRKQRELEFNEQWMIWMTLLSEDILNSLHELTQLVEKITMSQDYLHERMVELVEQLNSIQENRKIDATEARLIHDSILKLIQLTKIDIEIQSMDTSQDEDYARHVEHHELEQAHMQGLHEFGQELPELPICSIEKRLGLNVAQLRDIARVHDIKVKGNKRELCLTLSRHGLVRIV